MLSTVLTGWCALAARDVLEVHGSTGSLTLLGQGAGVRLTDAAGTRVLPPADPRESFERMYDGLGPGLDAGTLPGATLAENRRLLRLLDHLCTRPPARPRSGPERGHRRYVLGVHAGPASAHDAAACLTDADGTVLALVEEERISRVRHAPWQQPALAVRRCLRLAGVDAAEVTAVAVGWDVPAERARIGRRWDSAAAADFLAGLGLPGGPEPVFVPHHHAHAVSAFGASPYEQAAVLVADGNGEDESISLFRARRGQPVELLRSWPRVFSLGYLYEEASQWLGFGWLEGGKTMGLAAYGHDREIRTPDWIVPAGDDLRSLAGTDPRRTNTEVRAVWRRELAHWAGAAGTRTAADELAGDPRAVGVAVAAQRTVERCLRWLAAEARRLAGTDGLCLAGGA